MKLLSITKILLPYIIIASIIFLYSCHKTQNTQTGNYYITASDTLLTGTTTRFYSNVPNNVKIEWKITGGDSGNNFTSNDISPAHVFTKRGLYNATIIINDDSANINRKNPGLSVYINQPYDPARVAMVQGTRWWKVCQDSTTYPYLYTDTFLKYTDTFAVIVVDDSTIIFKNDTLKDRSHDRIYGVWDSYNFQGATTGPDGYSWKNLYYYYDRDSIVYSWHSDQGGFYNKPLNQVVPYGITTSYYSHK